MFGLHFNSLIELVRTFSDEQTCILYLEEMRWNGNPISPFDPASKVYKCAGNKYKCKNTGLYFNAKTNTLFDNTKIELQKWFMGIWLVCSHKKGISSHQLAKDIDVTQKTAWFMLQRIRNCFDIENNSELENEVEADETFIGGKNKNRHASKKVENSQGRSFKDKTPVLGMVERKGKLVAKVVKSTSSEHLTPELVKVIKDTATLYTDEWYGYNQIGKIYNRLYVKHNDNQFVDGKIYTNTIEGFWSLLKRGIVGIYHFVSRKHLQYYIDEFVFRYNTRTFESESSRFNHFLCNVGNKRLKYHVLIAD
ncbi:IS1595 family transposase [Dysgonomonas termitidis]|uniref:IS1595 family transposase n=1 Tax=Dysgonomonas termitidis TaxID=1516126 RepID=A0ABV9KW28_9BACT